MVVGGGCSAVFGISRSRVLPSVSLTEVQNKGTEGGGTGWAPAVPSAGWRSAADSERFADWPGLYGGQKEHREEGEGGYPELD